MFNFFSDGNSINFIFEESALIICDNTYCYWNSYYKIGTFIMFGIIILLTYVLIKNKTKMVK
jgi:hypothetical protein